MSFVRNWSLILNTITTTESKKKLNGLSPVNTEFKTALPHNSCATFLGSLQDVALAETIRQQQDKCFHTYGYRRRWQWLKGSKGIHHNPKTILHVMKKYGLLAEIRRRRGRQQMGQQLHKYENLLNRDFHAERPNCKWVTDISIFTQTGCIISLHDPGPV